MARPFAGYRDLAAGSARSPSVVSAVARFLFLVGGFVALTGTGRLAPTETISAMMSFAWVPVVHGVGVAVTTRLVAPAVPFRRVYTLYLEGLGPWFVLFLILSGFCLFADQPARPVILFLSPLVAIAYAWHGLMIFALFRAGLALGRLRAALATVLFYVFIHILILGYFLAVGQLWPIL